MVNAGVEGIDGATVLKQHQEKTLREYKRMIGFWSQSIPFRHYYLCIDTWLR